MGIRSEQETVKASKLINLTGKTIRVYRESSGEIIEIPPSKSNAETFLTTAILRSSGRQFIVPYSVCKTIERAGKPISGLLMAYRKGAGYDGKSIYVIYKYDTPLRSLPLAVE